jgi:uncharacterized protein (TIGR00369 family)
VPIILAQFTAPSYFASMQEIHKDLLTFVEQSIPFHKLLGIRVEHAVPGFARVRLPYQDAFCGNMARGALHGGVTAVLVDICGAVALWTHFGPLDKTATIDMRVDYQRPAPFDDLLAEGEVRVMGNRIASVHVRVTAAAAPDQLIAEGRCVYYVKRVPQQPETAGTQE